MAERGLTVRDREGFIAAIKDQCGTPEALADAIGLTRAHIVNVAAGRRGVSPEAAARIARALGSTTDRWFQAP